MPMMLGIRTEAVIFFYAWLSGCILFIIYQALNRHGLPRRSFAGLVVQKSVVLLVAGLELRILVTETIVDLLEVLCDR